MRILLDTHVFLWAATSDGRLSSQAQDLLNDRGNVFLLSVASVWEILVKASTGKLIIPEPAAAYVSALLGQTPATVLPIALAHVLRLNDLPLHHRDPFDRILVAQALEEGVPIVTADEALRAYPVKTIW